MLVVRRLQVGGTEARRDLRGELGVIRRNGSFIRRTSFFAGSDARVPPDHLELCRGLIATYANVVISIW